MIKEYLENKYFKIKAFFIGKLLCGCHIPHFLNKRLRSVLATKKYLKAFYPVYNESLKALLKAVDLMIDEEQRGIDKKFNEASLILLSRSIQHFEGVITLTENGLYGDAMVVLRGILSDMLMMNYLHLHPELIDLFLQEKTADYQNNPKFKKSFNEFKMIEELQKHGSLLSKESFSKISKASHPSSWGVQFYSTESKSKQQNLKYGPIFETKKALTMLSMMLSGPWDYLNIIVQHREIEKLDVSSPDWKKIKEKINELDNPISQLMKKGMSILLNWENF